MKTSLKRQVSTPGGSYTVRLTRPSKESAWRWLATVTEGARTTFANGDTVEEACDNVRDQLCGRRSR